MMFINDRLKSIFWVLMWSFCFSIMMAITKHLKGSVSAPMIVLVRLTLGFFYFFPVVLKTGLPQMRTKRLPFHFMRVMLSVTAMICTYYAYSHLPLATATSIGFIAPIMTTMLSIVMLGDHVTLKHWGLIFLGYLGVLVIVRPGQLILEPAILVAIAANLFASCSLISMKKLSETESTTQIMFWANLFSMALLIACSPFFWQTPTVYEFKWLSVLGFIGVLSQYSYTKALTYGSPSLVAPFEYSRLVFAIPIGLMFFDEKLSFWTLFGSMIIIIANTLLTILKNRQSHPA